MLIAKQLLIFFEILAAVSGLIFWKKIKAYYWKFFPIYLAIISLIELYATFIAINSTIELYHYFVVPFEFLFMFYLFWHNLKMNRIVIFAAIIYLGSFLVESFYNGINSKNVFLSISYSIGNLIMLVLIFQYFYNLIFSERILKFNQEPMFWVSLGLLLFYLGTFPYFGLYNLLKTKYFDLLVSYTWVEIFLNYCMYLLFAASFIWGKEK